jgi:hypothetical protein
MGESYAEGHVIFAVKGIHSMLCFIVQAMQFDSIKWEDNAITGNLHEYRSFYSHSFRVISSNAVQMDTVICIGFGEYNMTNSSGNFYHCVVGFIQATPNFKFTPLRLQTKMKDFALATCKDTLHLIGGEVLDSEKPSFSNLVISCVGQTTLESKYLPMKTASASPAVVTYKEQIVVVHGRGSKGEIEVLDTNSVNPVWVQIRVHFPFWETPSATIVGNTLVVWVGGLYCTSLEYIVANDQQSGPPGIYSNPAPQIEAKALRLLTLQGQLLAVDCSSSQYGNSIYAYRSATGEWVNIDNRKQIALALATSETSLVLFSTTQQLYSLAGCRGSVSCPV